MFAVYWGDADTLTLNGCGALWRLTIASGVIERLDVDGCRSSTTITYRGLALTRCSCRDTTGSSIASIS